MLWCLMAPEVLKSRLNPGTGMNQGFQSEGGLSPWVWAERLCLGRAGTDIDSTVVSIWLSHPSDIPQDGLGFVGGKGHQRGRGFLPGWRVCSLESRGKHRSNPSPKQHRQTPAPQSQPTEQPKAGEGSPGCRPHSLVVIAKDNRTLKRS